MDPTLPTPIITIFDCIFNLEKDILRKYLNLFVICDLRFLSVTAYLHWKMKNERIKLKNENVLGHHNNADDLEVKLEISLFFIFNF